MSHYENDSRIQEWYLRLPDYARESLDRKVEQIRETEGQVVKLEDTLTDLVKDLAREIEGLVDDASKISAILKHLLKDKVSEDTIEKALPQEQKRAHKKYETVTNRQKSDKADFSRPVTVSTDGIAHVETRDEAIDRTMTDQDKDKGVWGGILEEEEKEQAQKPLRIVMSAGLFSGLGKDMQKKVAENGKQARYVIEYHPKTRDIFTDVAEKGEEINAT
jgi:hypothetical protein